MYQSFWNLNRRPFEEVSSMADHFESESHQAAILKLRYLVEQRKGLALLIGEHGLGKTHLTRVFAEELQERDSGPVVRLDFPQLSPHQTLAYLAQRLGANHASANGEAAALIQLEGRLAELKHHGHHTVFVIDDAHLLEMEHLHFLRLLLNLRESGTGDFSVVLSGRAELLAKTQRLGALDQRAVIRAALAPLACEEVLPYLQHRLKAA
ncbi:MAG: AAA family ATPase, partial [Planctomycetaceae bacterium]|nr:AAA family ATPase [Planctomycetaceae bacterium]